MRLYCLILSFIAVTCPFLTTRGQDLSFSHLTVEQGLSQNSILCITQDSQGFMWFGTQYGLNRFDGYRVATYKNNPSDDFSLSQNFVGALLYDSSRIWIGTDGGLNKFNREKNSFEQILLPNGKNQHPAVNDLFKEKNGTLWAGTKEGLYFSTNPATNRFVPAQSLGNLQAFNSKNIRKIFIDSKGTIWIASSKTLYQVSKTKNGYSEQIHTGIAGNPSSLSSTFVQAFTEDRQGNVWIGTLNGLQYYNYATGSFTRYFSQPSGNSLINNNIRALFIDRKGKLWIGTQGGISILDPVTQQWVSYTNNAEDEKSLSQNSIYSLFEDAAGSMWVGTAYGGANVMHRIVTPFKAWQHSNTRPSISNSVVSSVITDEKNNLWIGTHGGGMNYYNRATKQFTVYKNIPGVQGSLSSNHVITTFFDKDKNLWIGTHGGGLELFNEATKQFRHYFNDESKILSGVDVLLEDSKGRFWVGRHRGLKVFRRNKTDLLPIGYESILKDVDSKNINALLEDQQHNIWIGASEGLYILDHITNSIRAIPVNRDTSPNINCIFRDSKGRIWLGLYNEGLARYNEKENNCTIYTVKNGLPNNNVLGILEDDKHQLWISTGNGLARFDITTQLFQTYTTSDGLPGNEFDYHSFYKSPSGEMFFGGIKGFTSFFPQQIERNTQPSALVFTGLKVLNTTVAVNDDTKILKKNISVTDKLVFGPQQNNFTIEFALLNFIRSNKNRYAYKLDGKPAEWIETSTPSATFTNLSPGNYILLVKGANNDGIWSNPIAMKITVRPPFWETGWAYLLYTLLVISILFFVVRFFYLRALLRRDKELHEVKLNFFTNISHEIRTHLTLIMAPIEIMRKENANNTVLTHHLSNAQGNADRLLRLVTELMDFRKAESSHLSLHIGKHKIIDFLNNIYNTFEEISLKKNIRLSFVHNLSDPDLYFDKEQMEKVIYNLLTNAFKFNHEGGTVSLQIEEKNNEIKIHIIDNGKGIAPEYLGKLFTNYFQVDDSNSQNTGYGIGLALSKTIVEMHKGSLTVESIPAGNNKEGLTRFTVSLLKGCAHFEEMDVLPTASNTESLSDHTEMIAPLPVFAETTEKRYHILITEDNAEVRSLIKQTLHPYQLTECVDGTESWQAATEQIPDLIISDVMMPEMDGFTLCHKLKTDERTSHIPVILLTAKSSQNDHVSGLHTGADVYLTKPFSTQVLELSVKNLLLARERMRQKFSKEFVLGPQNIVINNIDEQFLNRLIGIIEDSMENPEFGVDLLSRKMAMSQSVLYKKVKALTDMSVNDFAKMIRLKKAAQLLEQRFSILDVSIMTGFCDRKYFSKEFKKQFGKTPAEFIQSREAPEHSASN